MKTKRKTISILLTVAAVLIVIIISFFYFRNTDLIKTPTTHTKIEYLHLDNRRLRTDSIRFIIYDDENESYQICFKVKDKKDTFFFNDVFPTISIGDTIIEEYTVISHSRIFSNFNSVLIENYPKKQPVKVKYENHVITAYFDEGREGK